MKRFMTAVALVGAVVLAPATVRAQGMAMAEKDIIETAVGAGTFNTLAKALTAAGLIETLKGAGPFTVFAPTDAAFAKLPAAALTALLADKAKLTAVLTYHVVPGAVMAAQVVGLSEAATVQGGKVAIRVVDGKVMLNGSSTVTATDIKAKNGVIHVIDTVLMPPAAMGGMKH
jgi:uncharacterized surface protein with fasciclin (FAS1) repeats